MRALRKQLIISSLIAPRHLAAACWFSLGVSWDENSNKVVHCQASFCSTFLHGGFHDWCVVSLEGNK
jgi:hypothetical protein